MIDKRTREAKARGPQWPPNQVGAGSRLVVRVHERREDGGYKIAQ